MMKTGTRHSRTLFSLAVLLGLISHLLSAAPTQAQVLSDPRIAEFNPSPDHWAVLGSGQPAVLRYDLDIYVVGSSTSFATLSLGKPEPDVDGKIRYDFSSAVAGLPFPGGNYEARVSAVGPEGEALSEPSNPFTFTNQADCTISLNTSTVRAVASGGAYEVQVSTGDCCAWTAETTVAWVTLYAAFGTGSGSVPMQLQANTSTFGRTGIVKIGGQSVTVAQDGAPATLTAPTIAWATPAAVTQGTPLSSTQLNATANVPGTFVYTPAAGTVLAAGTHTLATTFTPTDSTRYTTAMAQVTLVVNAPRTTPVITWPTPAAITAGTPLSSTQLNAAASVPGTFAYNPLAGTVLAAGTYTLRTTFTPTDTTRYTTATASVSLTVTAVTYQLTISRPSGGMVAGGGISCGTTGTACQVTATSSTSVALQATPDSGYAFSGWTGDCVGTNPSYTLLLNGTKSCGAAFTAVTTTGGPSDPPPGDSGLPIGAPYTLTVTRPSGGVVRASPYIKCGTNGTACTVTLPSPMTMTLQARADRGYVFVGWTGHCSGASDTYPLALEGPRACSATFARRK